MRLNLTIGILSKPGGGKGTFKGLLEEICRKDDFFPSVTTYRFSDPLRKTLQWYEILESRQNMQSLSTCLRTCDPGSLAKALGKMIESDEFSDLKIADGVRSLHDEKMIRSLSHSLLVYVKTSQEIRFQRVRLRKENPGDDQKTWEKFLAEDSAEPERYLEDIGSRADFIIGNDGTLEDYRNQVRALYEQLVKPKRSQS